MYPFCLLWLSALSTAISPSNNANRIFNAIHSSIRQWGSSIKHNGMSFFLASVPQGTVLYHGTSSLDALVNIGWVVFDPEHASVFARPSRRHHHHANDFNNPQKAIKTTGSMDADSDHTG